MFVKIDSLGHSEILNDDDVLGNQAKTSKNRDLETLMRISHANEDVELEKAAKNPKYFKELRKLIPYFDKMLKDAEWDAQNGSSVAQQALDALQNPVLSREERRTRMRDYLKERNEHLASLSRKQGA